MSRFEKKLDNYYTKKLIEEIKDYLKMYYIKLIFEESKHPIEEDKVYIYINRIGQAELKEPRPIRSFLKSKSSILLLNETKNKEFLSNLKESVETTLEMISRGL